MAAPTAGLHFTPQLLDNLRAEGIATAFVTLHVGLDTFRPVAGENPAEHHIHTEYYELPAETAALLTARPAGGAADYRRRHYGGTDAGAGGTRAGGGRSVAGGAVGGGPGAGGFVHLAGASVSVGGRDDYEFSPAALDFADAGIGLCRAGADAEGLPGGHRAGLSVLQFWGCDADLVNFGGDGCGSGFPLWGEGWMRFWIPALGGRDGCGSGFPLWGEGWMRFWIPTFVGRTVVDGGRTVAVGDRLGPTAGYSIDGREERR